MASRLAAPARYRKGKVACGASVSKHREEWPQRFVPCVIVRDSAWRHHIALGQALDEADRSMAEVDHE